MSPNPTCPAATIIDGPYGPPKVNCGIARHMDTNAILFDATSCLDHCNCSLWRAEKHKHWAVKGAL